MKKFDVICHFCNKKKGHTKQRKFNIICYFFGYQARGSLPFKVDCDYAYVLVHICYHIIAAGLNGYMATVRNLKSPSNKWRYGAALATTHDKLSSSLFCAMLSFNDYGRYVACSRKGSNVYLWKH